jgi:hypothetical protein
VRQQPLEYGDNNIGGSVGIQKSVCGKNKAHPDQGSCPVDNKIFQAWDITAFIIFHLLLIRFYIFSQIMTGLSV